MMVMMVMMMVAMMIRMKTLEENVQNKARCSSMWASRPVLPSTRLWSNFAPLLLLSDFEDTSKMGRLSDYEDDVLTRPSSLQEEDESRSFAHRKLWHQTVSFATGLTW